MSVQDVALAFLVSQQSSHNAMQEQIAKLQAENLELAKQRAEERSKNPAKPKASKAPIHQVFDMKGMLRSPTVETATVFLKASRDAKSREESIAAIDAFVGYDLTGNFGAQDLRARTAAIQAVRPVSYKGPTRQEVQSACRSVAGFVHGLPDHQAKHLANLQAQAEKVTEAIIACENSGDEVGATVERERLTHVRNQIAALGF